MKTNYLLLDYENVQPKSLTLLNGVPFKVLVFLGPNQTKVPVEFAKELQKLGTDAEYIQISHSGSNALDFHIAFTIGELSKADANAYFHIISKDTGFDPLIQYAKKKGILVQRSKDISEVPILKLSNAKTNAEKIEAVTRNLAGRGSARPRKVKTLANTINCLFQNGLSESELRELVVALEKQGYISIEGESVAYHLSAVTEAQ
ncbi:MAG: PIN domain-containing protein [Gammaproteobacteria bacterium]